jgi:hypothetical protein
MLTHGDVVHRRAILPLSGSGYVGLMCARGEGRGERVAAAGAPRTLLFEESRRFEGSRASQRGRRGRWLGVLLSCLGFAGLACANPSNGSEAGHAVSPSGPAPSQQAVPQQVVQRIAPANPAPPSLSGTPRTPSATAGATGGAAPRAESAQAAAAETVTAKHVEAELNRLEAELK